MTRFEREMRLPFEVDVNGVDASLTDGILRVSLPITEAAKPKRVEIDENKALPSADAD